MKFNLTQLDFTKEIAGQLKTIYRQEVDRMIKGNKRESKSLNKIKFYHGTIFHHLNSILLNGLTPREISQSDGYWKEEIKSHSSLVYLTNKWHYMYAYNSMKSYIKKNELSLDNFDYDIVPCYVEVEVYENNLIIDEDFFHSEYVNNKLINAIKKGDKELKLTAIESIENYGTVAHIGTIETKNIVSFTLLGNVTTFTNDFMGKSSPYLKDLDIWSAGKGIGKMTEYDLLVLEQKTDKEEYNLTFWMDKIRKFPEQKVIVSDFLERTDGGIGKYRIEFKYVE